MCIYVFFSYSQNHLNLVLVNNVPLFFNIRDGPYMPTLRLLHQCKVLFFPTKICCPNVVSSDSYLGVESFWFIDFSCLWRILYLVGWFWVVAHNIRFTIGKEIQELFLDNEFNLRYPIMIGFVTKDPSWTYHTYCISQRE